MKFIRNFISFLVVVLLSGLAFIFYTEGPAAFSTRVVSIGESQKINGSAIKELLILSNSTDVKLLPHSGKNILIDFEGEVSEKLKNAYKLTVQEHQDTVEIELLRTKRTSFTIFAINKKTMLTVKIPKKLYIQIAVESKSGDINVSHITADSVQMKANSGDIKVEKIVGQTMISLETSSGDIDFDTSETSLLLQGQSNSGEGEVDLPGMLFKEQSEDHINGILGDGGQEVLIKTSSGDYRVY